MKWFKIDDKFLEQHQTIQKVKVNGKTFCLIQTDKKLFACATKCPHAGADISQGWIENENEMIVCPFHRYRYHLENGRGAAGQGDYIPVYDIEKRKDGFYIKLPYSWIKELLNI